MQKENNSHKYEIAHVQYSQNVINYNVLGSASTYFDMGFTLASTIARTLQFLMFSGNSWMPTNEWRMGKKKSQHVEGYNKPPSFNACMLYLNHFIAADTK